MMEAYFRYLLDILQSIDYGWTCTVHKIGDGVTVYQHPHYNTLRVSHDQPTYMRSVITPLRHNSKFEGGTQFRTQFFVNLNGNVYYDPAELIISLESHEKLIDELITFLLYNFY